MSHPPAQGNAAQPETQSNGTDQHPVGQRGDDWLLIPFAAIGAILAAIGIAVSSAGKRGRAKTGLVLNCVVIVVATWRLGLGGGLI